MAASIAQFPIPPMELPDAQRDQNGQGYGGGDGGGQNTRAGGHHPGSGLSGRTRPLMARSLTSPISVLRTWYCCTARKLFRYRVITTGQHHRHRRPDQRHAPKAADRRYRKSNQIAAPTTMNPSTIRIGTTKPSPTSIRLKSRPHSAQAGRKCRARPENKLYLYAAAWAPAESVWHGPHLGKRAPIPQLLNAGGPGGWLHPPAIVHRHSTAGGPAPQT